jgi:colanic acid biosynthesis glycosyl transferase WcaI
MREETAGQTRSITIINPHYPPETGAAAKRAQSIAGVFAAHGWETRVITEMPNHPLGRIFPGFVNKMRSVSDEQGIVVTRLKPVIVPGNNLVLRLIAELVFISKVFIEVIRKRTDVFFVSSPYMFNGLVMCFAATMLKRRVVWEIRDLTWLYAAAVNKDRFGLGKIIERIMLYTSSKADGVITTTIGQAEYFVDYSKPAKIKVFANGVSGEHFSMISEARPYAKKNFTVIYAGTIGYPQGLTTFIDAAACLPDIEFILVGDGVERKYLQKLVVEKELTNVNFTGYVSFEHVAKYYQTADILYAQLRNCAVFAWTQPSKICEYMAAGKPVIYGGMGEPALMVVESGGGVVVQPEDPAALASAIKRLEGNCELRKKMGDSGRRFVQSACIREEVLKGLVAYCNDIFQCENEV